MLALLSVTVPIHFLLGSYRLVQTFMVFRMSKHLVKHGLIHSFEKQLIHNEINELEEKDLLTREALWLSVRMLYL